MKKNQGIIVIDGNIKANNIAVGKNALIRADEIQEKNFNNEKGEKTIYFSYAWSDTNDRSREEFIDKLYVALSSKQYILMRDKMDLGYRGLISEFISQIGKGNLIVVAISDKYLKSRYCMFELYEIYRNSKFEKINFANKIFPIHVEYINLQDPLIIDQYFTFWEKEEKLWFDLIYNRVNKVSKEQFAEYDKVKRISSTFGDLVSFIMDMNALSPKILSENNFKRLLDEIDKKFNDNKN